MTFITNETDKWEKLTRVEKLGELLVKFNVLKLSQLTELIDEQRKDPSKKLGELAVAKGLITKEDLIKYLEIQIQEGKVVDNSLKELGQMTVEEKWDRLSQHERLGEIMVKRNIVKLSQLTEAMDEQMLNPSKHLGDILLERGNITKQDLYDALDWQEKNSNVVSNALKEIKSTKEIK
ncbi:MAG: hypothetical protein H7263_11880 [Candidatus Sericytochromatia bacterium]|nr:hypothetical protein [Candidatus Sericytochromatia bacterium]